jgi:hypothetical protein
MDSVGHNISTVNIQLATTQTSGILIRLSEVSKKMYHFYEVTQKQICSVHMFNCHVVLPATTRSAASCFPSCWCHYSNRG